jgi:hypothetical protein
VILESAPLTAEDNAIFIARARCGGFRNWLAFSGYECDRRDALIMRAAQATGVCPCCGVRYASLNTYTGGMLTVIHIRAHRRRLH